MIVKLHDGTEGDLIGWMRLISRHGRSGGVAWRPEIAVRRTGHPDEVLWSGVERHTPDDAELDLAKAVALAGLCFWPDREHLDLSPWVRDRMTTAASVTAAEMRRHDYPIEVAASAARQMGWLP